jgi:hypothetical protein
MKQRRAGRCRALARKRTGCFLHRCEFGIKSESGMGILTSTSSRRAQGAIGSGSYSDKPASSRRRNSSATSRAEASLPVPQNAARSGFRGCVRSAANGWRLCWRGAHRHHDHDHTARQTRRTGGRTRSPPGQLAMAHHHKSFTRRRPPKSTVPPSTSSASQSSPRPNTLACRTASRSPTPTEHHLSPTGSRSSSASPSASPPRRYSHREFPGGIDIYNW